VAFTFDALSIVLPATSFVFLGEIYLAIAHATQPRWTSLSHTNQSSHTRHKIDWQNSLFRSTTCWPSEINNLRYSV